MGYFQVRYDSRVVIYDRRAFIRLATENTHRLGKLVSSFTSLNSADSLHTKNIFSLLVKSSLVKLETNCIVILPLTVTVLCSN